MALFHFTRQEPPLHFARDGRDGHNTRMTRLPSLPDLKLHLEMASTRQLKQTGPSRVVSIHLDVDLATSASERNNKHPFTAASPTTSTRPDTCTPPEHVLPEIHYVPVRL